MGVERTAGHSADPPPELLFRCFRPCESAKIIIGHRLSADTPGAGLNVLDRDPCDLTQAFAFNREHGVGHFADHLLLLCERQVTADAFDLNKGNDIAISNCYRDLSAFAAKQSSAPIVRATSISEIA